MERRRDAKPSVPLMAALKMFELGRLSSGKAAELAGMSRIEFFEACSLYHVSIFNYRDDEIEAELASELDTIKKFCNQDQHHAQEQDT
jgi:predicted HTH domain antitoxin